MTSRIVFNGVEYATPDEMPPEVRARYNEVLALLGDRDADGTPDVLQSAGATSTTHVFTNSEQVHGIGPTGFETVMTGPAGETRITGNKTINVTLISPNGHRGVSRSARARLSQILFVLAVIALVIVLARSWPS